MSHDKSPALQVLLDGYFRDSEIKVRNNPQYDVLSPSMLDRCIKYVDGEMIINGKINYLKSIESMQWNIDLFPKSEIEGIKDCYIYTKEPLDIYYRIGKFLTFNTFDINCTSIECEIRNKFVHCMNVKGNMNDLNDFEINFKMYLSRNYQYFNNQNDNDKGKIYVLRIKRIRGECITFWRIRKQLITGVLSYFDGLPQQFINPQTNKDGYHLESKSEQNEEECKYDQDHEYGYQYEYTIYNNAEERTLTDDDDDGTDDFVWIPY